MRAFLRVCGPEKSEGNLRCQQRMTIWIVSWLQNVRELNYILDMRCFLIPMGWDICVTLCEPCECFFLSCECEWMSSFIRLMRRTLSRIDSTAVKKIGNQTSPRGSHRVRFLVLYITWSRNTSECSHSDTTTSPRGNLISYFFSREITSRGKLLFEFKQITNTLYAERNERIPN